MVPGIYVGNGGAIADHITIKMPRSAEVVTKQHGTGAGGSAINRIVGAHDGLGVGLGYCGTESRQVCIFEIVRLNIHIEPMPQRFGTAVHSIVLRSGHYSEKLGIGALHPVNERHRHAAG